MSESVKEEEHSQVQFVENEITISVGESAQAKVITSKENVYIFWSIRDENIATVTDKGVITGLAEGQTICYAAFGGETAICLVKVTAEETTPMLSVSTPYQEGITICVEDTFDPLLTVRLGDTVLEDAQIEYSVSAPDIVTVSDGVIVACGVGNATVSVEVTYEGQTTSLSLAVQVFEARS